MIRYNGVSSDELGFYVQPFPHDEIAELDVTSVDIPGRDGKLYKSRGHYKDVEKTYQVLALTPTGMYSDAGDTLKTWLTSAGGGFARLEDSNDPYVYMLARFDGPMDITNRFNVAGRCDIKFIRRGKRFLKMGDLPVTLESGGTISNPTGNRADPVIEIAGTGDVTFTLGTYVFEVTDIGGNIIIDTERQDCYYGNTNKSGVVTLTTPSLVFPALEAGITTVSWTGSGTVTSFKITPRWWKL